MQIQINLKKRKVSILLFIYMWWGFASFAQKMLKDIPFYDFMATDINRISYPDNMPALNSFYVKFDSLIKDGKGKINIAHIGGSHIQADIYSQRLRNNLLNLHPNLVGERGLIFPFSAAKTNNPSNYKTTYKGNWSVLKNTDQGMSKPLGVSGISITTKDSIAEISISMQNEAQPKHYFNRVRIIGNNVNYMPVVYTDSIHSYQAVFDKKSSSFLFDLTNLHDSFTLKLYPVEKAESSFTVQGILLENDHPGITYHAIGVNGASVPSYLKCEFFERDLKLLKPDLVILSIGINDAVSEEFNVQKFKENYDLLLHKIKNVAPHASIIFTTNNDSYRKKENRFFVNTNGLIARKAFFELAVKHNAAVWDLFMVMGGLHAMKNWEDNSLSAADKIHFKKEGYFILGDLLFNALISEYFESYY